MGDKDVSPAKSNPKKWYQWVLMYPAIALAFIGAVPQAIEIVNSFVMDVEVGTVKYAEQQKKMWQKNFNCVKTVLPVTMTNQYGATINVTLCQTGDILLSGTTQGNEPVLKWVAWSSIVTDEVASSFFIQSAVASTTTSSMVVDYQQQNMCWWPHGRYVRQRVSTPQGCFDYKIDTYTGRAVGKRQRAPCTCRYEVPPK